MRESRTILRDSKFGKTTVKEHARSEDNSADPMTKEPTSDSGAHSQQEVVNRKLTREGCRRPM